MWHNQNKHRIYLFQVDYQSKAGIKIPQRQNLVKISEKQFRLIAILSLGTFYKGSTSFTPAMRR